MPPLPRAMPPLPVTTVSPLSVDSTKKPQNCVPMEYPQNNKSWDISEDQLPHEYKSRWEDNPKRKSGWGSKTFNVQCFGYLPQNTKSTQQIEVVIRKHRIDDLTRRLIVNDFEQQNDPDLRSPSPEPIYDAKTGQRTNTLEQRLKEKYVKERYNLITEVLTMDASYIAPPDYKPPKKHKKIFIPETDDPLINFIGQIIGPGG